MWIFYLFLLSLLSEQWNLIVSCEFSFGYPDGVKIPPSVNLSYIDPSSRLLISKSLSTARLLTHRAKNVGGIVIHIPSKSHVEYGCDQLHDILPKESFVALVKHGDCSDQVELASIANAAAIVIYSVDQHARFDLKQTGNNSIFIVIDQKKGEWLANLVDNGTKVMMQIHSSADEIYLTGISHMTILFIYIAFMIVMMVSFAWIVFYYLQRFRYTQAKEVLSRHICSAAIKALDRIPVATVKNTNPVSHDIDECCIICIESFQPGELVRTLPCSHCFHKICIDPWLLEQRSCPICKLDILLHFGLIYSGSQESVLQLHEDELRRPRPSFGEQEIVLVQNERRHSIVKVAIPADLVTSPCIINEKTAINDETSLVSPVSREEFIFALNHSDLTYDFTNKISKDDRSSNYKEFQENSDPSFNDEAVTSCQVNRQDLEDDFEVCDVSYEN